MPDPDQRTVSRVPATDFTARKQERATPELKMLANADERMVYALQHLDGDTAAYARYRLKLLRSRSILLLGYWANMTCSDLSSLSVTDVNINAHGGLTILGGSITCKPKSTLCPVAAYTQWRHASGISGGPLYRRILGNGQVSHLGLHPMAICSVINQAMLGNLQLAADPLISLRSKVGWMQESMAGANQDA